jgi:4-hydroxy-3-polyprenylbenzoate decarboxylase
MSERVIVGISGASGAIYGITLLQALRDLGRETHLVLTRAARETLAAETDMDVEAVRRLAGRAYDAGEVTAPVASGSFLTRGMVVAPCSIKSLSAIASSYADNLLTRAADVCLKEGRRLILLVRETPLHRGHLRLMSLAAKSGAVILPPMPAFYHRPRTVDDIVHHTVGKALDLLGIDHKLYRRWEGA